MPPGYLSSMTECEKSGLYEEALFALASGQQKVQVRHGEYWVQYGTGSVTYLERALARSRALCGNRTAVLIGRTTPWPQSAPYRRQF